MEKARGRDLYVATDMAVGHRQNKSFTVQKRTASTSSFWGGAAFHDFADNVRFRL